MKKEEENKIIKGRKLKEKNENSNGSTIFALINFR